jgi:pimeloyl-ACP methyl ester carboxylesterase
MAVELAHLEHPAAEGETAPPLLIAHGLFGSARNFHTLGRRLASNRRVIMVAPPPCWAIPWAARRRWCWRGPGPSWSRP